MDKSSFSSRAVLPHGCSPRASRTNSASPSDAKSATRCALRMSPATPRASSSRPRASCCASLSRTPSFAACRRSSLMNSMSATSTATSPWRARSTFRRSFAPTCSSSSCPRRSMRARWKITSGRAPSSPRRDAPIPSTLNTFPAGRAPIRRRRGNSPPKPSRATPASATPETC